LWMMAVLAAAVPATALAAPPTSADFEKTPAKELPDRVKEVVDSGKTLTGTAKQDWAKKVCQDFTQDKTGVNSPRAEVRLNAAILIHNLGTLSSDKTLVDMLKNKDAAVRYWAARGLEDLQPAEHSMAAMGSTSEQEVIKALGAAVTAEAKGGGSSVVIQQIVKTLKTYGAAPAAAPAMLDALDAVNTQMEGGTPDVSLLETAGAALDSIASWAGKATPAEKVHAVGAAAMAASFAAQQQDRYDKSLKESQGGGGVPDEYARATQKVVDSAVAVCKAAGAGTVAPVAPALAPADYLRNVNKVFGVPGTAGTLQKELKDVPIPKILSGL
jgi:hypothetical protein